MCGDDSKQIGFIPMAVKLTKTRTLCYGPLRYQEKNGRSLLNRPQSCGAEIQRDRGELRCYGDCNHCRYAYVIKHA